MYKSHANRLSPVRRCSPDVPDDLLRELPQLFATADTPYRLDPSHEHTHAAADPARVAVFNKLKLLRNGRLVQTLHRDDLYYAALNSNPVTLTPIGKLYWRLARLGRI
jgi:hypothetical protein